ncbi:zinc finger MYM-type protein 1-like [Aphis craccivora]|uniref:Zinc finger MYM-type protein 1-like n=1 Tax=Aphis craccivora TaxID=307492 RepID=A0A6G0Y131_APHCR|nr:zinc finger MYM-type protein 1-like [Aphis craccivora]
MIEHNLKLFNKFCLRSFTSPCEQSCPTLGCVILPQATLWLKKQPKINFFFQNLPLLHLTSSDSHSSDFPLIIISSKPLSSSDPIITEPTSNDSKITDIFDVAANFSNKIWKLDLNYNFPIKTSVVGKKQKIVKFKWFFNFPCLAYSKSENGAICKYCVAFAKNEAAIILCGRQNLALSGHCNCGKIDTDSLNHEGNFREILRYHTKGDIEMQTYFEGPGKMKYISH